jgi:hypothetical protein
MIVRTWNYQLEKSIGLRRNNEVKRDEINIVAIRSYSVLVQNHSITPTVWCGECIVIIKYHLIRRITAKKRKLNEPPLGSLLNKPATHKVLVNHSTTSNRNFY